MSRFGRGFPAVVLAGALAALLVGCSACGSSNDTTGASSGSSLSGPTTTAAPKPAGRLPSEIAKQVCQSTAQREIASALGVKGSVGTRIWIDHRYSCPYVYSDGSFTLSIKELSSWDQTLAYYHGLGHQLGVSQSLANLGQGAFQTTGGNVVVRKDWKVLLVDISKLPPQFGVPETSSADVAVTIADVILGCWAGD